MKNFFTTLPLLLSFLFASGVHAQDGCPPGFDLVEIDGEVYCQEIIYQCAGGDARGYVDNNDAHLCCLPENQLVIYDDKTRVGVCCGQGQVYTGIKPAGKCCPPNSIVNSNGACVPAPPPSSCQGCPAQPPGACQLKAACGDATNNGLQYSKCYRVLFPSGNQLGRGLDTRPDQYIEGGYIQNIPYQICNTTTNCGTGPVNVRDTFFIKDLVGPADGSQDFGWIQNKTDGAHMGLTVSTDEHDIAKFEGKTSCSSCKCVVQLIGVGYACPNASPGFTLWPNRKVSLKFQFLEIPCNGKFSFPQ